MGIIFIQAVESQILGLDRVWQKKPLWVGGFSELALSLSGQ
jgi:hypothetical protein